MWNFLKTILRKINSKSDNKEQNVLNKIIYSAILICGIVFIGFIVYSVITQLPSFIENMQESWDSSSSILKGN